LVRTRACGLLGGVLGGCRLDAVRHRWGLWATVELAGGSGWLLWSGWRRRSDRERGKWPMARGVLWLSLFGGGQESREAELWWGYSGGWVSGKRKEL